MYRPVPPQVDLPAMERDILDFWAAEDIFRKSVEATRDRPIWVFYEGPPTANGTPGTHHVEARAFKDIFPRYRTMKGYHVPRRAGWDCHGLPVELAVERELGFSGKGDIERYGVTEFNEKCRESVLRHVDEFTQMTERMGYWVDFSSAYWTMNPEYIDSVWWSLKQIFDKGLLVQDHRVSPYCPRCGTGLSDHELAQGYETVVDPSVYVRFPVIDNPLADRYPGLSLLIWTTTPWTLVSNTAVAVKPDAEYAVARNSSGEHFVINTDLAARVLGDDVVIVETFPGTALEHMSYQRPFDLVEIPGAHFVLLADYVTTDDGTGLVHQAPAFGADDLATCRAYGLPMVNPIRPDGHFDDDLRLIGGEFFKKADDDLVADLARRDLLFANVDYQHAYPHCWRCHTPLIYYAQPSWYVKTTAIKDALLRENEGTNWYPETIKWGRYGDWLNNNVDWALSRDRYWGTPLPIWRCPNDHLTAIGSRSELSEHAGHDVSDVDPHRPFVDDITFPCPECGDTSTRVPEVIDCWYDSGAMPFAQVGFPHRSVEEFKDQYPADFICEAIDQTRGWFYTLMAIGTLVFDESSYRNVVCLGHILDEDGRKMSKHLGNVLEPIPLMDEHGADAVRWFMLASGSPWQARRVGHNAIEDVVRKTLLTYWNTASFQALYARTSDWDPSQPAPSITERPALDRWIIGEAHRLARDVDASLDVFDTQRAGRAIAAFIDDLSNWYVRRSRRRFWDGDPAALATLHEALRIVTLVMAPFTPFITERVWQDLFHSTDTDAPISVHLASWPAVDAAVIDDDLSDAVHLTRRLVELGRAARATSSVKTRQPLAAAMVAANGWESLGDELRREITDELNVMTVVGLSGDANELVDISVKANFRGLGKRFGKQTQIAASAIAEADAAQLVTDVRKNGAVTLPAGELGDIEITADDVVITEVPRTGWAVASDNGETVALDLTITPELRRAGIAREVIRLIQDTRKSSNYDVADRIDVSWQTDDEDVATAIDEHADVIAKEVLAMTFARGEEGDERASDDDLGLTVTLRRR